MGTSVLWFRRDLRLGDNPALGAAVEAAAAGEVVPLFVLDPRLLGPSGRPRATFLLGCLSALDEATGGRLVVRHGDPVDVVPAVAGEVEASAVSVAADFGPYGRERDEAVEGALERPLVRTGSPYVVDPGTITRDGGGPYKVFTPFYRSWRDRAAAAAPVDRRAGGVRWAAGVRSDGIPAEPRGETARLPPAGEAAALGRLEEFRRELADYGRHRDRPDLDATSRLSPYLRFGCLHPRTVLAGLGRSAGAEKFRAELAWREFYADVLWHRPSTARESLQEAMAAMAVDDGPDADDRFEAWAAGRTGYPFVDAGMRQLQAEAWMPNRVRMVVASFLVKDLHLDWTRGARWFMRHLVDGDLASNQHNWQWVAGTGTDPVPFFRVFNPVAQGREHDPGGDYVRRWVPELAGIAGPGVHEPWRLDSGMAPTGYPPPIVDHAAERAEALARYAAVKERAAR